MISAVLLSGGKGTRMGVTTPKQYLPLAGKPVALHSFELLAACPLISELIVVCTFEYAPLFKGAQIVKPGPRRQDSLANALQKVSPSAEYVCIHDASRPLLSEEDLKKAISYGKKEGAAALATLLKQTVKQINDQCHVVKTLDCSTLYAVQTPQVLKKHILLEGLKKAKELGLTVPDDVFLAELNGYPVRLVIGSNENIKITTPEELSLAENIIRDCRVSPIEV